MKAKTQPILLVEDDPNDIALFRRAVLKSGIRTEIQIAEDGEAAVQLLQTVCSAVDGASGGLPRIILLDLKLPRRSGLEVLAWLREQSALRCVPIIILTSSREPLDVQRAYELGANSYLVKPVSFDQLKDLVQILHRYWIESNESSDHS
jgi:CheY-like chemotaxis protein